MHCMTNTKFSGIQKTKQLVSQYSNVRNKSFKVYSSKIKGEDRHCEYGQQILRKPLAVLLYILTTIQTEWIQKSHKLHCLSLFQWQNRAADKIESFYTEGFYNCKVLNKRTVRVEDKTKTWHSVWFFSIIAHGSKGESKIRRYTVCWHLLSFLVFPNINSVAVRSHALTSTVVETPLSECHKYFGSFVYWCRVRYLGYYLPVPQSTDSIVITFEALQQ